MIDVRLLRTDLDGVRAALARRRRSGAARPASTHAAALDERLRDDHRRARRRRGPGSTSCRSRSAQLRRDGDVAAAEALQAESRAARRARRRRSPPSTTTVAAALRDVLLAHPQPAPPRRPRRRVATPTTRSSRARSNCPTAFAEHQRVPHWEIGTELGILDNERATKISGSMFTMTARPRGDARPGAVPARPRPQRRRLRGDPPAVARHDGDADGDRPAAEVRRRRLRHRARRPVVHPDRRGAAHVDLRATRSSTRPTLPMRLMAYTPCYRREAGSAGRDTRGMLRAHEFDKVEILALATPEQAPALLDEMVGRAEAHDRRARPAVPHHRDLHRRPRPEPPPQLRHRGLRAGRRPVAGGVVGQLVQRLPGPPGQHPLPPQPSTASQKGTEIAHTLNGSALAVPRVWAAIVENYRQPDGSVA